jgi:hypothetical protein
MKKLCFILLLLWGAQVRVTNLVYLAPTAVGGNTGADCADAKAYTYFNSSGNWSATPTGIQIASCAGDGVTIIKHKPKKVKREELLANLLLFAPARGLWSLTIVTCF